MKMTEAEINNVFRRVYNGKTNFITPYVAKRGVAGNMLYELSYGADIFNPSETTWGVTFLHPNGDKSDLSSGGFTREEAETLIADVAENSK